MELYQPEEAAFKLIGTNKAAVWIRLDNTLGRMVREW